MRVTDTMELEMIELREQGYSNKDIARFFGLATCTVAKHIGKEPKGLKHKEENNLAWNITMNTIAEMIDMAEAGKTNAEIAETLGISEDEVQDYLGCVYNKDDDDIDIDKGDCELNTIEYYEQVKGEQHLYSISVNHTGQTITILRGEDALIFRRYDDLLKFMDELEIVRDKVRDYMDNIC